MTTAPTFATTSEQMALNAPDTLSETAKTVKYLEKAELITLI
jgi:hypothetical protein